MAAFLKASELPATANMAKALIEATGAVGNLSDRALSDALTVAAARNSGGFLRQAALAKSLTSSKSLDILAVVALNHARNSETVDAKLLTELANAEPKVANAILGGLAKVTPRGGRIKLDAETEKTLVTLMPKLDAAARGQLLQLAKILGSFGLRETDGRDRQDDARHPPRRKES